MSMLDPADMLFQRGLIRSMARTLAELNVSGKEEEDLWVERCAAIGRIAVDTYGEPTALALLDQARTEARPLIEKLQAERARIKGHA